MTRRRDQLDLAATLRADGRSWRVGHVGARDVRLGARAPRPAGYPSTSRAAELAGHHTVELAVDGGQLVGRSLAQPSGSRLEPALTVTGSLAAGTWTERTSPTGHYRAATYQGTLQLVVDPTLHSMRGRWLGPSKHFTIKSGEWLLERAP